MFLQPLMIWYGEKLLVGTSSTLQNFFMSVALALNLQFQSHDKQKNIIYISRKRDLVWTSIFVNQRYGIGYHEGNCVNMCSNNLWCFSLQNLQGDKNK